MTDATVVTSAAEFHAVAEETDETARIPVEVRTTVVDPFEAYRRARHERGGAYLETTGGQSGWGYFGVDPIDGLTVSADAVLGENWWSEGDSVAPKRSATLEALDGLLADESLVRGDCDVPYPCGALGWFSYDVARELESLPADDAGHRGLPRVQVSVYDCLAAWEEPREGETTLRITACPVVGAEASEADVDACYDKGLAQACELARRAHTGDPEAGDPCVETNEAVFESTTGHDAFAERVHRVKQYIRNGDGVFAGLRQRIKAGRFHSLAVERADIPDVLVETASTDDERDVVMAVRHRNQPHVGVQFHPESILTDGSKRMIKNFLTTCRGWEQ